jgi:hypothetical protein
LHLPGAIWVRKKLSGKYGCRTFPTSVWREGCACFPAC